MHPVSPPLPLPADLARDQQRFWAYAAAFGAAWGSLEIVVGSFLHALRLPFSGALLAAAGAALLVAQRQVLPVRGLTLATGLVAAACKSLSPGGVILGPMVGISAEAALVELALLAGSWVPSAAAAGALAALWAASQKVLVQYLLYGGDILSLYVEGLRRASGWLGAEQSFGFALVAAFAAGLALVGASGGLLGLRAGRECRKLLRPGDGPR